MSIYENAVSAEEINAVVPGLQAQPGDVIIAHPAGMLLVEGGRHWAPYQLPVTESPYFGDRHFGEWTAVAVIENADGTLHVRATTHGNYSNAWCGQRSEGRVRAYTIPAGMVYAIREAERVQHPIRFAVVAAKQPVAAAGSPVE